MEQKVKKTLNMKMRALHRDIGFLIVGLVVIYGLSGIVLVFRDTGFLKHDVLVEKTIQPNIEANEIGRALWIREFKVTKTEGDLIYFKEGTYNKSTGLAKYTTEEIIFPFNKFLDFHRTSNERPTHFVNVIFALLLLFMVVSSFWMFKKENKLFRRGLIFAGAGVLLVVIVLLFV